MIGLMMLFEREGLDGELWQIIWSLKSNQLSRSPFSFRLVYLIDSKKK